MQHETFPATAQPATEAAGPAAEARIGLSAISRTLDAHFMPAGQTIARLVETTGAVLGGLEGIGRALGDGGNEGDAADHLQAAAQGLHTEPERRARRGGQIAHMRAITERLSLAAAEILRILTVLRFYTVNLKIASAGADEFVEFAEDMNLKLAEGSGHVEAFRRQILAMRAHLNDMCALDEVLAGECARVVPAVPDRLIGHVAQLRCWQQALEALSRGAQASITRLQAGVGRALEAIQIGDITRQRLEHVADACERLDSALADPQLPDAAGTRAHMLRLLAAQLEDLTTDFAAQSGVLLAALDGMAPDCDALLGHGEQQSGLEESGLFLRDLDNCIGAAHGMTSQLQRADAKAGQLSDVVLQVAGALRERVQGIENLRFDVDYMAINVNIRARRDSRIGRPVAVIADEIRICSQQLAELTQTVSGMADDLGAVSRSFEAQLVAAGGPGVADTLGAALDTIRSGARDAEAAMAGLDGNAHMIVDAVRAAARDLAICNDLARQLEALNGALREACGAAQPQPMAEGEHPLAAQLQAMAQTYTMASERAVHNRFLLPGMAALGGAAAARPGGGNGNDEDDDDLDGVFL